jgi:hypothetical protein
LPAWASTAIDRARRAGADDDDIYFSFAMTLSLTTSWSARCGACRNAKTGIAFHGAVDDVGGIAAQTGRRSLRRGLASPTPVLAHVADEGALLSLVELRKAAAIVERLARPIDGTQCRAVKLA